MCIVTILIAPDDSLLYAGSTSLFVCVAKGTPNPNITWWRDDMQLLPDDRIKITMETNNINNITYITSILQICDAHYIYDTGEYMCIAEVPMLITNASFEVFVQAQVPVIETVSANQMIGVGTEIALECSVSGSPLPVIYWLRDGIPAQGTVTVTTVDVKRVNSTIELGRVNISATYTCLAVNELGETNATVIITVQCMLCSIHIVYLKTEHHGVLCYVYFVSGM